MTGLALEWSYNPWRERPGQAWGGLAALLLSVGILGTLELPLAARLALFAACAAALGSAFLPVRCRLDGNGATRWTLGIAERRAWTELRRAARSSAGVLLSPFEHRHWLEPYRALFLPLPPRARSRVADDLDLILSHHDL